MTTDSSTVYKQHLARYNTIGVNVVIVLEHCAVLWYITGPPPTAIWGGSAGAEKTVWWIGARKADARCRIYSRTTGCRLNCFRDCAGGWPESLSFYPAVQKVYSPVALPCMSSMPGGEETSWRQKKSVLACGRKDFLPVEPKAALLPLSLGELAAGTTRDYPCRFQIQFFEGRDALVSLLINTVL
jgi:hypothetical protein